MRRNIPGVFRTLFILFSSVSDPSPPASLPPVWVPVASSYVGVARLLAFWVIGTSGPVLTTISSGGSLVRHDVGSLVGRCRFAPPVPPGVRVSGGSSGGIGPWARTIVWSGSERRLTALETAGTEEDLAQKKKSKINAYLACDSCQSLNEMAPDVDMFRSDFIYGDAARIASRLSTNAR
jgi:hypothetical protein